MKFLCVIPARYASTRLPGKPLADIQGKPMIQRVYERACLAKYPDSVVVATDNEAVFSAVKQAGGDVVMTDVNHITGTDRLAEVARSYSEVDVIINVQGDEPLIDPVVIDQLAEAFLQEDDLQMATMRTIMPEDDWDNPNQVKVVVDQQGYAMYFSRSRLPYQRNRGKAEVYKHIGIYAYRRSFLVKYAAMSQTPLELAESLEQLRVLENGYKIKVLDTSSVFIGVDTPEDLAQVNEVYRKLES